MNVALIMERIETWRGGAETSTMQFAHHLARLDCKVSIITASLAQSTSAVNIIPLKAGATFRASKTLLFSKRAADYVRKNNFDIVHAITPCIAADIYQPRGGTIPETLERNLDVRSSALQKGFKKIGQKLSLKYRVVGDLERKLLQRKPAPWVIAISNYVTEQLKKHYGLGPSHVREIFNGVDPDSASAQEREAHRREIRRQFGLNNRAVVALCIAHNFKLKGVAKLIEAVNILERTSPSTSLNLRLLLVGRDKLAPYIRQVERLGLSDRVIFAGPTQRIHSFFHAADFLVHPTFYDPCSRVVLEALAAGLPVITTRFNGAAERITDGRQGFVVDSPHNIQALADRIGQLLNTDVRQGCATQAVAAVNNFTMARHAAHVRKLYEDILGEGEILRAGYR